MEIKRLKKEIDLLITNIELEENKLNLFDIKIETLTMKKLIFDEHEKETLKKQRLILEVGQKDLEISKLKNKLSKWKSNKERLENNIKLEKKILTISSEIDIINNKKENLFREIEYSKNKVETLNNSVLDNNLKIEKIKKENNVERVFRAYLTVFGKNGIIKTIVKSVVPKLNNELMRLLSDVTNFMVEIRVNENYYLRVVDLKKHYPR